MLSNLSVAERLAVSQNGLLSVESVEEYLVGWGTADLYSSTGFRLNYYANI
jgi:hypothetical protein